MTANSIIDELTRFSYSEGYNPDDEVINLVYQSTVHGSPLRKLMRDFYLYSTRSSNYLIPHVANLPAEFYRDIFVEFLLSISVLALINKILKSLSLPEKGVLYGYVFVTDKE